MEKARPKRPTARTERWRFVLYTAGPTPAAKRAEAGLRQIGEHYLPGRYEIEIVNVTDKTASVPLDILAVPMVVRAYPTPERRVVGDLSEITKAARGLGLPEDDLESTG